MKRKLIKQGGGGYTIYLPKKWVDSKGLSSGDQIDVKEIGTALNINASIITKKEITLELTEQNKQNLRNMLTHLYRRGFDRISIKNIDDRLIERIKQITQGLLLGFEITETDKRICTLENISEPTEEKYAVLLKRVYLIIKETHRILLNDFKKSKYENLKAIEDHKTNQDKFVLFCKRILTKERYEIKHPITDWELLSLLMHIEHAYYYLYLYAAKNRVKANKRILELIVNLGEYFQLNYDAYYKKDISSIHKINELKHKYQFGKCYEYIEQAKAKEAVVLAHIRELFRLVQIGISPILSEYFEGLLE